MFINAEIIFKREYCLTVGKIGCSLVEVNSSTSASGTLMVSEFGLHTLVKSLNRELPTE